MQSNMKELTNFNLNLYRSEINKEDKLEVLSTQLLKKLENINNLNLNLWFNNLNDYHVLNLAQNGLKNLNKLNTIKLSLHNNYLTEIGLKNLTENFF